MLSVTADPADDPPGSRSSAGEAEASVNIRPVMRSPRLHPRLRAARSGIMAGLNLLSFVNIPHNDGVCRFEPVSKSIEIDPEE